MLLHRLYVSAQICNRTDRLWYDDKAIGISAFREALDIADKCSHQTWAGKLIVGHRGVAEVGGEEYLLVGLARHDEFAVGERTVGEGAVDADLVLRVCQLLLLTLRHAESPAFLVIRGDVGNPVGLLGLGVDMFQQFLAAHHLMNRHGVAKHMEVAVAEVDNGFTIFPTYPTASDIPLFGHGPIKHLCT